MEARAEVMEADSAGAWLTQAVEKGVLSPCRVLVLSAEAVDEAVTLGKLGFKVFLVDGSRESIDHARARARGAGVDIETLQVDVFATKPSFYGPVELIYDGFLLASLSPEMRADWAHIAGRILPKGGLLAGSLRIGRSEDGPPYSIPLNQMTFLLHRLFNQVSLEPAEPMVPGRPRLYRGIWRRK